jgi:RNA polymerase sigma-70 factor (ECF subfamily)
MRFGRSHEDATAEALERLYRSRFHVFLRVAASVAGERHAADAVHEGFVRALRHRRSFRQGGSLEAWVWRTVVNAAHDVRRASRDELALDQLPDTRSNGHQTSADDAVRACVVALPPQQRLAVFLRYYADLDYEVIAEILDVSPGTVASTLHTARAAIRTRLQEDDRCKTS